MKSWTDATPDEIRDAKIADLYDAIRQLKQNVSEALRYGTVRPTSESGKLAADILDEEWVK